MFAETAINYHEMTKGEKQSLNEIRIPPGEGFQPEREIVEKSGCPLLTS